MLLRNYSVLNDTPGRWFSGGATGQGGTRASFNTSGPARGRFYGQPSTYSALSAWPAGYSPSSGGAFVVAQKSGGIAASLRITGAGSFAGAGALGYNLAAPLSGSGDMTGIGALIVSAVAALSGAGDLVGAINGILGAAAALSGSGDLASAISAPAYPSAALSGAGAVTAAISAIGELSAAIIVTGDALSTANVAEAVWGALLAVNQSAGSMGEALGAAGSAGDPWITPLPGAYGAGTAGKIVADALSGALADGETLAGALKLALAALAGKNVGTTLAPEYRAVDDSKTRITATINATTGVREDVVTDST